MTSHQRTAAAKIRNHSHCIGVGAIAGTLAAFGMLGLDGEYSAWAQAAQCRPTQITSAAGEILSGYNGTTSVDIQACAPGDALVGQGHMPAWQRPPDHDPGSGFYGIVQFKPCDVPLGSDLPNAKVTVAFASRNPAANATKTFTLGPDKQKPTLKTTSQPAKGTKVRPGDRIRVRMEASEEYDGTNRFDWQTGVKKIQLRDESLGRDVPPYYEDNGPMRSCANKPWKQWLEVTYIVPPNPPPIIRLRATAWDFAGNKDDDVGEFPTEGDWHGTFTFEGVSVAAVRSRASADIVLNQDGQGNLRGTMSGQHQIPAGTSPNGCSWQPGQPNRFRVSLVGSYAEGRSFKVFIDEVIEDTGIRYMLTCSGIPIPVALERAFSYAWGYKAFLGTPSPLGEGEVAADGTRLYKFGSEAGPGPAWTVTLRPARN